LANGITPRQLQHPRFVRIFPSVYRLEDTLMTPRAWVQAGRLALPADARASHQTRLLELGVQLGPLFPLHFTVPRDLHLAATPDHLFLHRTVVMPRTDGLGVDVPAALLGAASLLRLVDVVKLADWLLHREHLDLEALRHRAETDRWRPGAEALRRALDLVDPRSRSLPESEVRCVLVAAGLPRPEVNVDVHDASGAFLACGDLVYRWLKLLVEYEGRQHAFDVAQFEHDIHRYGALRLGDWVDLRVSASMLRAPAALATTVHRLMVRQGYEGPPPSFSGARWREMFDVPAAWRHQRNRTPRGSVAQQLQRRP
jgi:hypothetical protein